MLQKDRWIAALLILGTPLVFFGPLFATCGLGPMEDDLIQYFPFLAWLGQHLRAGEFPIWNALAYGGYPAIGDPQSGLLYPPNWIAAALSPCRAYPLLLVLHYWLAGWGMYLFGRAWNLRRLSAVTGALAWMFCGFMLGHRTHYTILAAASWMSVLFYLWAQVQQSDRPSRFFALAALVQGLQVLAGHVQVAAMTGTAVLVYLVITSKPLRVRMAVWFALSYLIAFGLAAAQLFPVWQLFGESVRTANSYRFVTENSFFPVAWPLIMAPASLGMRTPNFLYSYAYYGPWNQCELLCFTGVVSLVLAAFALRSVWRERSYRRLAAACLILIVLGVFLALGRYNPAYRYLFAIPIFRPFRCPARYLLWFNFAAATLAMVGMEGLIHQLGQAWFRRFAIKFAGGLSVVFVGYLCLAHYLAAGGYLGRIMPAPFQTIPRSILEAIHPSNPAVFIPVLLAAVFMALCRFVPPQWLPRAVLAMVVVEAATFVPFYDFRFDKMGKVDLTPPAARVLDRLDPKHEGRIWPLSCDPYVEPLATLEPFCNMLADRASITGYGPLLNKYQRRLFGWELWPTSGRYLDLLTRVDLLNRCGIRYVIADPTMALRIDRLKQFTSPQKGEFRQFLTGSAVVRPGALLRHDVSLAPGLYKLRFRARRPAPDQLRLFIALRGLTDPLWTDAGMSLVTWDVDEAFRLFEWPFFIPEGSREIGIEFTADTGECELKNVNVLAVPFDLQHLEKHPAGVYENTQWTGEAFFAEHAKVVDGEGAADARMRAVDGVLFDQPRDRTWLAAPPGVTIPDRLGTGSVTALKREVNSLRARVSVQRDMGLLVLSGGFDTGWQALVDNREVPLLCADGISRAVLVPAGEHNVSLTYLPQSLVTGAAVSTFAVLILVLIFAHGMVRKPAS